MQLASRHYSDSMLKATSVTQSVAVFFYYSYGDHQDLHSFPTRRSSDLEPVECRGRRADQYAARRQSRDGRDLRRLQAAPRVSLSAERQQRRVSAWAL